jgi:hypothetical protein
MTTFRTALGDVALGRSQNLGARNFESIDQLVQARTTPALQLLGKGAQERIRLTREGVRAGTEPLEQFTSLRPFEEQQALLGLRGEEAQEQAIGDIPVSEFDRQLQERQRKLLLRQQSARGELGGGASLAQAAQLAGAQQSDLINRRLAQLDPLVSTARNVRGTISQLREQGRAGEAQIQSGLGSQLASIRLGATAPQIAGRQQEAELSGLRGISAAQRRAQTGGQLAQLAGSLAQRFS